MDDFISQILLFIAGIIFTISMVSNSPALISCFVSEAEYKKARNNFIIGSIITLILLLIASFLTFSK